MRVRTLQSLETGCMSCVGSFWPPGNWGSVGQRICCSNAFQITVEREERSRHKRCAIVERQRQSPQKIFERNVDSAVRGEMMAQRKLYEAEADVKARNWEKKHSDFALEEINQEFESQRLQLHQASRWADQARRDKISLYGELELRK